MLSAKPTNQRIISSSSNASPQPPEHMLPQPAQSHSNTSISLDPTNSDYFVMRKKTRISRADIADLLKAAGVISALEAQELKQTIAELEQKVADQKAEIDSIKVRQDQSEHDIINVTQHITQLYTRLCTLPVSSAPGSNARNEHFPHGTYDAQHSQPTYPVQASANIQQQISSPALTSSTAQFYNLYNISPLTLARHIPIAQEPGQLNQATTYCQSPTPVSQSSSLLSSHSLLRTSQPGINSNSTAGIETVSRKRKH